MDTNYNPFRLDGKTILVTGASSGIGRSTAIECSKLGATVVITARNESRLQDTLEQMAGNNHQMIVCDMSDIESVRYLIEKSPIYDGVVNNAGINKILPIQFVGQGDLMETMQVNALSPIMLTQGLLKKKKVSKDGSIVFVSSIAGHTRSTVGNTMYCASKGAVTGFVKCLAKELASKRIRCNEVMPGQTDTPIMAHGTVSDEDIKQVASRIPLKRLGMPIEIAEGIVFLLSNASSYITGSSLIIDGGSSL